MAQTLKNNFTFFLDDDLQVAGTTVAITKDQETDSVVTITDPADVTLIAEDGSQIERMVVTCAAGTMTCVTRGIKNDSTGTADAGLKKKWLAGQKVILTIFASKMPTLAGNNAFSGNNTFSGDNTFSGAFTATKYLQIPVFANAAARDVATPSPADGMMCYRNDIEDFNFYKNGVRVVGLGGGGGGGGVRWKDSSVDGTLTGAINGVNTAYVLSNTPGTANAVQVIFNGVVMEKDQDYTLVGKNITFATAPVTGKIVVLYPDFAAGFTTVTTRATTDADANNGELYRSTDHAQALYYKNNAGVSVPFPNSGFVSTSAGAGDAGKGVVLNGAGQVDPTMLDTTGLLTKKSFTLGENMTALDNTAVYDAGSGVAKIAKVGATYNSATQINNNSLSIFDFCYIDTNKIVVLYSDTVIKAVCGTISGNTITRGTPVSISINLPGISYRAASVCKVETDTFAIGSVYQSSPYPYITCCTVSGTTITVGTPVNIVAASTQTIDICRINTNKVAVSYSDGTNLKAVVATISGTTPTLGSIYNGAAAAIDNCIINLDTDKFLIVTGNVAGSNKYAICSVSGTTITELAASTQSLGIVGVHPVFVSTGKVLMMGKATNDLYVYHVTISGSSWNTDSSVVFSGKYSNSAVYAPMLAFVTSNKFFAMGGSDTKVQRGMLIGTGLSALSEITIASSQSGLLSNSDNKTVLTGYDTHALYNINDLQNQRIGILQTTGNAGDSKVVSLRGGQISSGHSSLLIGENVYMQTDGTFSHVVTSTKIGMAISTTEILLD